MDQIAIKVGSEFLDLPDDVSVSFEFNSPLFSSDVIPGSFSFPFNISAKSAVNRRLLQRPDMVQKTAISWRIDCLLYIAGKEYSSYLKIATAVRNDQYTINIFIKDQKLFTNKDTKLTALDLPEKSVRDNLPFSVDLIWNNEHTLVSASTNGGAGVIINGTPYEYVPSFAVNSDTVYDELCNLINADVNCPVTATRGPVYNHYPCVVLTQKQNGPEHPFSINKYYTPNPLVIPLVQAHFIPNNYTSLLSYMNDAATQDLDYVFAPVYNPSFFDDANNPDADDVINKYLMTGSNDTFLNNDLTNPRKYSVIPFPRLRHALKSVLNVCGYQLVTDIFSDEEINNIVLHNLTALDRIEGQYHTEVVGSTFVTYLDQINMWAYKISLQEHLPAVSVSAFLAAVKNTFACALIPYPETNEVKVRFLKDIAQQAGYNEITQYASPDDQLSEQTLTGFTLKYKNDSSDQAIKDNIKSIEGLTVGDPVATVAALPLMVTDDVTVNQVRLVTGENSYYQASLNSDPDAAEYWVWSFYCLNLFDVTYGTPNQNIDTGNSLYLTTTVTDPDVVGYITPYIDQRGISKAYSQPFTDFALRFMFYRGVNLVDYTLPIIGHIEYQLPTITRGTKDLMNAETYNYAMELDGEKGLFQKLHKPWLDFLMSSRPVTRNLRLPANIASNIQWDEFYRIENVNYLVKKISFSISKRGISQQKTELLAK